MRRTLLVLLALVLASPAAAWQVQRTASGAQVHWLRSAFPVPYQIQADGSDDVHDGSDVAAVAAGFEAWTGPACSAVEWARGPDLEGQVHATCTSGVTDAVWWEEATWPPDEGPEVLAVTTTCYDSATGTVGAAFMVFNGVDHTWATDGRADAFDIQSTATHESGHWLGLAHSDVANATMWPYSGPGETSERTLASDDVLGICHLYPLGIIGDACTDRSRCRTGTGDSSATCNLDWEGGYCTAACTVGAATCPGESYCAVPPGETDAQCLARCGIGKEGDCRDGYACHEAGSDLGVCAPPCTTDAECGAGRTCEQGACRGVHATSGGGGGTTGCGCSAASSSPGLGLPAFALVLYLLSPRSRSRKRKRLTKSR